MPYSDGGFSWGGIECDPGSGQSISHTRTERRSVSDEEDPFFLAFGPYVYVKVQAVG